jgi:hypothetical protein
MDGLKYSYERVKKKVVVMLSIYKVYGALVDSENLFLHICSGSFGCFLTGVCLRSFVLSFSLSNDGCAK